MMAGHAPDPPDPPVRATVKVVVRYIDGRVLRGTTVDFDPKQPEFSLDLIDRGGVAIAVIVPLAELKAVFFVRDATVPAGDRPAGPKGHADDATHLVIEFTDGERMTGLSYTYDPTREGFFLFPTDADSNNERVYVLKAAVVKVDRH
jgi:hypothetical protein